MSDHICHKNTPPIAALFVDFCIFFLSIVKLIEKETAKPKHENILSAAIYLKSLRNMANFLAIYIQAQCVFCLILCNRKKMNHDEQVFEIYWSNIGTFYV